jgi:hypothetical protein
MGDKKRIDKFFQEQFRDFEAKPPQHIWENINRELEKENNKQKRIVPLWVQFSGIAASLVFLITVGMSQFTPVDNINENVVDGQVVIEDNTSEKIVNNNVNQSTINDQLNVNKVDKTERFNSASSNENVVGDIVERESVKRIFTQEQITENSSTIDKNGLVLNNNKNIVLTDSNVNKKYTKTSNLSVGNNKLIDQNINLSKSSVNNVLVDNHSNLSENEKYNVLLKSKDSELSSAIDVNVQSNRSHENNQIINDGVVVSSQLSSGVITVNDSGVERPEEINNKNSFDKYSNDVASSKSLISIKNLEENASVAERSEKSDFKSQEYKTGNELLIDKNSYDVENSIASNNTKQNDTAAIVSTASNTAEGEIVPDESCVEEDTIEELPIEKTIEEAIAEQEEVVKDDADKENEAYKKWKIAPNIAPVYYNSLTSGSPIDDDFSENTKKGQFTTSYGIGVGYALNKRLSVRTGVNRLEVGYDTQDVAVYSSPETSGGHNYKNINFSSAGADMSIAGSGTYSATQIPSSFSSLFDSSLNQRFGYLEVPLELSYKLSDKKLRVDVIAGVSTFFLNKNEIYSENKTKTTYIGEANNLNKMSYSTNLGIGLEYKLSKALNFNFDPMFKYQLNAFSNDAGNFKPYILGIYSGLSYRF